MKHLYDNLSNTIREIVKYEVEQALKALKQEVIKDLVNTNSDSTVLFDCKLFYE